MVFKDHKGRLDNKAHVARTVSKVYPETLVIQEIQDLKELLAQKVRKVRLVNQVSPVRSDNRDRKVLPVVLEKPDIPDRRELLVHQDLQALPVELALPVAKVLPVLLDNVVLPEPLDR